MGEEVGHRGSGLFSVLLFLGSCVSPGSQSPVMDAAAHPVMDAAAHEDGPGYDLIDGGQDALPESGIPDVSGYASACPSFTGLSSCAPVPDAGDCAGVIGCGLDGLPSGLQCSGLSQCAIAIHPCAGWQDLGGGLGSGPVDGYICSCVDNSWSCADCAPGGDVCAEGGVSDALAE